MTVSYSSGPRAPTLLRRRVIAVSLVALLLSGCAQGFVRFPVTPEAQQAERPDVHVIRLSADNISAFESPRRGPVRSSIPVTRPSSYAIGAGDILNIIVFDHPELTVPAGPERSAQENGFQVQEDGTFFYPFIGQVQAAGRSAQEIRVEVTERLAEFIPNPNVEVRIASYNSQSVVVSGAVDAPLRHPIANVRVTLLDAINGAGGAREDADLRAVALKRNGNNYVVDLRGFLENGFRENNPVLQNGDVVFVPRRQPEEAYILGEINRPSVVDLADGPVSLTQAVARLGGLREQRADSRGLFVFRKKNGAISVFQIDTTSPEGLVLGTRFILEPSDVVYIVRSPLQRWNDTITRLLPSVSAVNTADSTVDSVSGN